MRRSLRTVVTVLVLVACMSAFAGLGAAQEEDNEDDDDPVIKIDIGKIVDAIGDLLNELENLAGSLGDIIVQAGLTLLVKPFQFLANALSDLVTHVMVSYPDVRHPMVQEVHWLVYQLTLLLAVPVVIWIGFQHMTGRMDGIRPTAKLIAVLVAGGLAPWLLYYPVELSRLVSVALRPDSVPLVGALNLTLALALVIILKATLLLFLVLLYVIRDFYLLFFTAAAPLIFLLAYFRPTRNHVQPLIGLFTGFLLIAPLDLIAYRLVVALLDMNAADPTPYYLWGLGGLFVMLAIPYVVLQSGSSLMLPAFMAAQQGAAKVGEQVKPIAKERFNEWNENRSGLQDYGRRAKNRFMDDTVDIELRPRSKNEVEMHRRSTLRNKGKQVRNRFQNEEPVDVEVEGSEWWHDEAELKERD